jgi:hypothetical protein
MPTDTKLSPSDKALVKMLKGAKTRQQLGLTRYALGKLSADKLIKRAGEAKNSKTGGRKAVTFELMAKGRKRAEKL